MSQDLQLSPAEQAKYDRTKRAIALAKVSFRLDPRIYRRDDPRRTRPPKTVRDLPPAGSRWRHRFTGQVRVIPYLAVETLIGEGTWWLPDGARHMVQPVHKMLAWLKNAEPAP